MTGQTASVPADEFGDKPIPIEERSTGTRGGCADLAQTWFSSFRSGIGLRDGLRGSVELWRSSAVRAANYSAVFAMAERTG
jgi:hypothetical protein